MPYDHRRLKEISILRRPFGRYVAKTSKNIWLVQSDEIPNFIAIFLSNFGNKPPPIFKIGCFFKTAFVIKPNRHRPMPDIQKRFYALLVQFFYITMIVRKSFFIPLAFLRL